ncbi:MAG TPA: acyl-CoA dehydrogenase family protein [Candidatus Dormibacteraeota bacterium]|jgi:alkylation response protein AidB-like acyl-CoA dehydrogenase
MPLADLAAWVERADRLAVVFAAGAARHDREGSFPDENVAAARADGWPGLAVPAALGGAGASLHDVCVLQERLARGDTSSALGLGMHHMTVGAPGPEHTGWPEAAYRELCGRVTGAGALVNALASEPEQGSPARGGLPATTAERGEGGWVLEGRKTWSTWLPALTHAVVPARVDEPGAPPRAAAFLVELSLRGVGRDPAFDALGLRASASGTLRLDRVTVAEAALLHLRDPGGPDPRGPAVGAWFQLTSAAAYTGCAHAARDEIARFCRDRRPNAMAEPISSLPTVRLRLGRIDGAVRTARLLILAAARAWDQAPPDERAALLPEIGTVKVQATQLAWQAVEEAMRLAGGPGLLRDLSLERHWRDVRGGLVHPPLEDLHWQALGAALATGEAGDGRAVI